MLNFKRIIIFFSIFIGLIIFLQSCNYESPTSVSNTKTQTHENKGGTICIHAYNCETGLDASGAYIIIKDQQENVLFEGKSDASGTICFDVGELSEGEYTVEVHFNSIIVQKGFHYDPGMPQPVYIEVCLDI
jgi:hypothetical protein